MPSSSPKNSSSPPHSSGGYCRWGPYSGSSDFDVHMATILVILVLTTIVAFTLHAALRFLLRLFRRSPPPPPPPHSSQQHKQHKHSASSLADAMPTLVFSPGTKLAGGAECAICLSEFAEGDRVRVLPACNHGFHVKCVEGWLISKLSCPTCRASCRPVAVAVAVAEP